MTAEWSNNLQEVAESTRLGIPTIVASNPRNHVTIDNAMGVGLGETTFSTWPGELGLVPYYAKPVNTEFEEVAFAYNYDVITGKFNPTGKMPISIPVSQAAAENNQSDVPGYREPEGYALFKFGDGLSY